MVFSGDQHFSISKSTANSHFSGNSKSVIKMAVVSVTSDPGLDPILIRVLAILTEYAYLKLG